MDNRKLQNIGYILLSVLFLLLVWNQSQKQKSPSQTETSKDEKEKEQPNFIKSIEKIVQKDEIDHSSNSYVLENDQVAYSFFTKGAQYQATIKNYKNQEGNAVTINQRPNSHVFWKLPKKENKWIYTCDLDFKLKEKKENSFTFINDKESITITYTLQGYILDTKIQLGKKWDRGSKAQLICYHSPKNQETNKEVGKSKNYVSFGTKYEYVETTNSKEEVEKGKIFKDKNWVNFHIPYFNNTLFFPENLDLQIGIEDVKKEDSSENTVKKMVLLADIDIKKLQEQEGYKINCYIGEDTYQTVQQIAAKYPEKNYEKVHYFGWRIFGTVNKWVLTPCFNTFNGWVAHPILALLFLLLLFSLLFAPLSYKQQIQQIKMKASKPFLEELKAKANEKQKFIESAFYRKVGINPLIAIIVAIKNIIFFLSTLFLVTYNMSFRQRKFLWFTDLSSFDNFITLPFYVPMIGSHIGIISIALLLLPSILKRFGSQEIDINTMGATKEKTQLMKFLPYISSFMFFGITNSRPAILGIARFFSLLIEKAEKFIIDRFINADAITETVIQKASQEEDSTQSPSRNLSRLEKRMDRKNNKKTKK